VDLEQFPLFLLPVLVVTLTVTCKKEKHTNNWFYFPYFFFCLFFLFNLFFYLFQSTRVVVGNEDERMRLWFLVMVGRSLVTHRDAQHFFFSLYWRCTLSHVCGVAEIVHQSQVKWNVVISSKYEETRNSCLLSVKYGLGVAT
jgi:hypothetical protein